MPRNTYGILTAAAFLVTATTAFADDPMNMKMSGPATATQNYRFELAGSPKPEGSGKNIVAVRLIRAGKPVSGAIVIQSKADMSPIGMGAMTASVTPLGEQPSGTYRFEVSNGQVWKKPDNSNLSLGATTQGAPTTVTGNVVPKLTPFCLP